MGVLERFRAMQEQNGTPVRNRPPLKPPPPQRCPPCSRDYHGDQNCHRLRQIGVCRCIQCNGRAMRASIDRASDPRCQSPALLREALLDQDAILHAMYKRTVKGKTYSKICPRCGKTFTAKQKNAKTCSGACRQALSALNKRVERQAQAMAAASLDASRPGHAYLTE